jgi:L-ascorbate metabolism protein UlaG (beta-lactamase superfamily)
MRELSILKNAFHHLVTLDIEQNVAIKSDTIHAVDLVHLGILRFWRKNGFKGNYFLSTRWFIFLSYVM